MNVKREGNPHEENISAAPSDHIFFEQLQGFALESQTLMVPSTEFMENI